MPKKMKETQYMMHKGQVQVLYWYILERNDDEGAVGTSRRR